MSLNSLQWEALSYAVQLVSKDLDMNIYTMNDRYGCKDPLKYGVNWCACGTQTAEDTLAFANRLQEAAQIAQMLTDMKIDYSYALEGPEMDKETYLKHVKALVEMIKLKMSGMIEAVLDLMI